MLTIVRGELTHVDEAEIPGDILDECRGRVGAAKNTVNCVEPDRLAIGRRSDTETIQKGCVQRARADLKALAEIPNGHHAMTVGLQQLDRPGQGSVALTG